MCAGGVKWRLQEVEGAGLGLVATESIQRGEIIFTEQPLLVIPAIVKSDAFAW